MARESDDPMALDPQEFRIPFHPARGEDSREDPRVRFVRRQLVALLDAALLTRRGQPVEVDGFELVTRPGVHALVPHDLTWEDRQSRRRLCFEEITLFLTTRCDNDCSHCPEVDNAHPADLPLTLARALMQEARRWGVRVFSLTGGEPALYPSFEELSAVAEQCGLKLTVVSNGRRFQPYAEILNRHPGLIAGMTFSLDGHDAVTHDACRGENSFRDVMGSMAECIACGLAPGVNICLQRKNWQHLEAILNFVAELPVSSVSLLTIHADQDPAGVALSLTERAEIWDRVARWKASRPTPPGWPLALHPALYRPRDERGIQVPETSPCDLFRFLVPAVRTDGAVYFCCNVDRACYPLAHLSLDEGGVLSPSLDQIESAGLETARRLWAERQAELDGASGTPGEVDSCDFCCRAIQTSFFRERSEGT